MEMFIFIRRMTKAPGAAVREHVLGLMMSGPTIIHWEPRSINTGTCRRSLRRGNRVEGLSEPNAGSDLAARKPEPVEDGDYFVVNGQKVWTSYAHRANYIQLFVRTDPTHPNTGYRCLIVDIKTPGVTVRPLVQITGDAEFNEVFFEDVRVPRTSLLGPRMKVEVLVTTLMHERVVSAPELPGAQATG